MASFDPVLRIDETAFRALDKIQPKLSRKPLTDMTNTKKPLAKSNSTVKNFSTLKASKKVEHPKVSRKPLGDLTNSNNPQKREVSSNKNCIENNSGVNKGQFDRFGIGEGFLHNHGECIKAYCGTSTMSLDGFLETVSLKRDSSTLMTTPQLHGPSNPSKLKLETSMVFEEMDIDFSDICAPRTPTTPKCPRFPGWGGMEYFEFSPLRLKESPIK